MGYFDKRKPEDVGGTGGSNWEPIELDGLYKVKIEEAFLSRVVYPENKTHGLYLTFRVYDAAAPISDGTFPGDPATQIGRVGRTKISITPKNVQFVLRFLNEVSGSADLPDHFLEEITTGWEQENGKSERILDFKALAERAPINPGQLVGRKFLAYTTITVSAADRDKHIEDAKKFTNVDIFKSYLIEEADQEVKERNIFDGEDEISYKVRERFAKGKKAKADPEVKRTNRRTEGLSETLDLNLEEEGSLVDDLPF